MDPDGSHVELLSETARHRALKFGRDYLNYTTEVTFCTDPVHLFHIYLLDLKLIQEKH